MIDIKRFPKTAKVRIIYGSASIFTTVKHIRDGIGDSYTFNAATQKALDALEYRGFDPKSRSEGGVVGITGNWEGINIQIDVFGGR